MRASASPRIVISGIGVVSPFGVGRERFWECVSRGCSGTRAIAEFDASEFACRVAAPVTGVTIDDVPPLEGDDLWDAGYRADPKRYSRSALIGVIAAREAWKDAGLRIGEPNAGVVIGSGGGGIDVGERQYHDFFMDRGKKVTPYAIPVSIVGMVSSEVSISLRLRGVSHVLSCGCTSSTDAIGYAAAALRSGEVDAVLSGGTDACVTPGMIFGFSRMKVVSMAYNERPAEASRPFDRHRDGFVLGEGAWMMVLEREDRARARGATIYASIDGYASTCDAYHRVQMAPDGAEIVRALALAIERSGRRPDQIGYVN
ncbi:MAG: beta-ketoacyl-[acyl-carrier-protein] synthase family protein, partial [Vicinamibacterales bacterium]